MATFLPTCVAIGSHYALQPQIEFVGRYTVFTLSVRPSVTLLAHLSRRLVDEVIGYPCSGVGLSYLSTYVVVQNISISNISETACLLKAKFYVESPWVGGGGDKSLFLASGSHDQDDRHAHI